jgi:hypothetical protein
MEKDRIMALVEALYGAGFKLVSITPDAKPGIYADKSTGALRDVMRLQETTTIQIVPIAPPDQGDRP